MHTNNLLARTYCYIMKVRIILSIATEGMHDGCSQQPHFYFCLGGGIARDECVVM